MKLGMKNWLFVGHSDAGWRSAVVYSIVGTCKLLNVNPEAYLTWVLPRLAAATTKSAVRLLPHDFAARALNSTKFEFLHAGSSADLVSSW
jgi:hypothetical protein